MKLDGKLGIQFGKEENMSNLDFLLDCTDISEVSSSICENGNTIVRGIFYGSEDLSWTEVEYIFDRKFQVVLFYFQISY